MTEKYYDDWALNYDLTLKKWRYKAPQKAVKISSKINKKLNFNLDLACGTGMFAEEIKRKYKNIIIDGCDISSKSLKIAKQKKYIENYLKRVLRKKLKLLKNMT